MEELCETRYMSLLNRDTVQQSTTSTVAQESTANLGRGPEILDSSTRIAEASTPEQRSEQKWRKAGIIPMFSTIAMVVYFAWQGQENTMP